MRAGAPPCASPGPRVAFYAPLKAPDHPTASGDRLVARLLVAALERAGWRVDLVSRFRSYDAAGDSDRQRHLKAVGAALAGRLAARFRADPPAAWLTYHLYHKAPDWLGPAVCGALGVPYAVAEASFAPKRAGGPWDLGHRAVAAALRRAALVVALNRADMACVRARLDPAARVLMLPPFLDPPAGPARPAARARVVAATGIRPDVPWLLTVAMMRERDKLASYRVLGQALAGLGGQPWRLLVAGDGPARAAVGAALAFEGVHFLGLCGPERLADLYAAADLFVWPAVNEAFGMVFLEAQAAGCPVVGGRTGGVPDVVAEGETGLLAEPGNPLAFAAAVRDLLDDPGRRRALGAAAAHRVRRDHHIEGAARRLGTAIARIARPRGEVALACPFVPRPPDIPR